VHKWRMINGSVLAPTEEAHRRKQGLTAVTFADGTVRLLLCLELFGMGCGKAGDLSDCSCIQSHIGRWYWARGSKTDMKVKSLAGSFSRWAMVPVLVAAVGVGMAQGNSGHDRDDHRDDHHDNGNRGDDQRGDNGHGKKGHEDKGRKDKGREDKDRDNNGHDNDYQFREQDRQNFESHYDKDVRRWRQNPQGRAQFVRGQRIPDTYQFQVVPSSYYRDIPPPPPGYRYGYHDGYVVAYNPTTRIIADVLDLVTAAKR